MQCHFPVLRMHHCVSGGFRTPVLIHHTETSLLPLVKPLYYLNPTPSQDLTPLPRIGNGKPPFQNFDPRQSPLQREKKSCSVAAAVGWYRSAAVVAAAATATKYCVYLAMDM